jgi:hypothetical protein
MIIDVADGCDTAVKGGISPGGAAGAGAAVDALSSSAATFANDDVALREMTPGASFVGLLSREPIDDAISGRSDGDMATLSEQATAKTVAIADATMMGTARRLAVERGVL